MENYNELYSLFRRCFPSLDMTIDAFTGLLRPDECHIMTRSRNNSLIGCAVYHENNIRLLCVAPECQHRGIGSEILLSCEDRIRDNGFDSAVLGEDGWFLGGAVLTDEEWSKHTSDFFGRRGYIFSRGYIELSAKADDISMKDIFSADGEYRFITADEHEMLLSAVEQVDKDWCQYFNDDSCTFAAFHDGKIVSFCITEDNMTTLISGEGMNIGSVGCVGTVPSMRRKGFGLTMVGKASEVLKNRGCHSIYIHCTHLDKWYGRLGFKPFIYFGKGSKSL